jgi:ketosteroid isomerase-like protein
VALCGNPRWFWNCDQGVSGAENRCSRPASVKPTAPDAMTASLFATTPPVAYLFLVRRNRCTPFASMTPQKIAQLFVSAINAHDVERLGSLMTSDHRFIDSLGAVVEGREATREGWKFYFCMVPDYKLDISHFFIAEDGKAEAVLVGVASGSYWSNGIKRPDSSWSTPAALRAVVSDGQIAEWQVYADNEPIREQMRSGSA